VPEEVLSIYEETNTEDPWTDEPLADVSPMTPKMSVENRQEPVSSEGLKSIVQPPSAFSDAMSRYTLPPPNQIPLHGAEIGDISPAKLRSQDQSPRRPSTSGRRRGHGRTSRHPLSSRSPKPAPTYTPPRTPPPSPVNWDKMFKDTEFVPKDFSDVNVEHENRDPLIRRQKQEILFQLLKAYPTESNGQWHMRMPLFELKYELHRREQFKEEEAQIKFMHEMMKMLLTGAEMMNDKFGPFLQLKGWSKSVTSDMSRYDRCMKALYHRYFRKTTMSPIMELLWLIVGSAIMFHVQEKFLGGATKAVYADASMREHTDSQNDIRPPPDATKFPYGTSGPGRQHTTASGGGLNIGSLLKLFTQK
jgi:hypothetical protein